MASQSINELQPIYLDDLLADGRFASFVLSHSNTAKQLTGDTLIRWLADELDGHGGVINISEPTTEGNRDTYTIELSDHTQYTFTVTNGLPGGFANPTATVTELDEGSAPTVTVTASGADTAKRFAFQFGIPKGNTGTPATVLGWSVAYQKSNQGTTVPTGEWLSSIPQLASGEYLWTRSTVRFNSGQPISWYGVSRRGENGDGTGTVKSVGITAGNGISVVGDPVTEEGFITVGHSNSIGAKTTSAVYPVKIDSAGHISEVGEPFTKGVDHSAKTFTVTLGTDWVNGEQTVSHADFATSGYAYTVAPASNSYNAYAKGQIFADDITVGGKMTFHCNGTVPSVPLTVNIMRVVSA